MKAAMSLAILLAACGKQAAEPANQVEAASPAAKPAAPAAKPFVYDEDTDLLEFHFGWSAEAAAVPQLVDRFRKEMEQLKTSSLDNARESKANSVEHGFEFRPHMYSKDYETAGQSDRLLSLRADFAADAGGAHGNYGVDSLLWDRTASKEIKPVDLFAAPGNRGRLLTQRWCDALNKLREEKRGEPVGGEDMFDECPKLSEISFIPADKDRNGKFERLLLIADPYVAGPYVEGSYEVELPVTADLIAVLKADYRPSFEVQPQ